MPAFRFFHGLGDTANLCRMLPLYAARGEMLEICTTPDKRPLIELAGHRWTDHADAVHPWAYPAEGVHPGPELHHQGHKVAAQLGAPPAPAIGTPAELWPELLDLRTDLAAELPEHVAERARVQLSGLPRPVVLLHSTGNTDQQRKSLSADVQRELALRWIEQTDGTLILLDWDRRAVGVQHPRVIHLDALGGADVQGLLALIDQADLLIGVDSGPLHLAGLTRTPALGLWAEGHHPARYLVPRPRTLNLVPDQPRLDAAKRAAFRIISGAVTAEAVLELALQLLGPRRYVPWESPADEVLLQWAISQIGRAHEKPGPVGGAVDRGRSIDLALRLLGRTACRAPQCIVETGTVRQAEDTGAGWSTWLWGLFCRSAGGVVESIDLDAGHCDFARRWTADFRDAVRITTGRGEDGLRDAQAPIDLLYLDSCDTEHPEHQQVCLDEFKAALPRLHDRSLVLIDDSPTVAGQVIGKGGLAVPWAVRNGWRVIHQGYQVLLDRGGREVLPAVRTPRVLPAPPPADGRPVVYTVLIGDRDQLADLPATTAEAGADFVCLTDRPRPEARGWEQQLLPREFCSDRMDSRRPKCLPHVFFPDAPWSLYLDASVQLTIPPGGLTGETAELLRQWPARGEQRPRWWAFAHPERSCLWAEAAELIRLGMADRQTLERQLAFYDACGMPRDWGLPAGGVLLRSHTPAVIAVCEDWWREICLWTERDQVSLPFVLWRHGLAWQTFPEDLHGAGWLTVRPHTGPAERRRPFVSQYVGDAG